MKKHIIFDFDDTISSAYDLNQQLFVDTFLPYMSEIDQDYLRNFHFAKRGTSMISQFEGIVEKYKINVSSEQLVEENEQLHQKRAAEVKIFNGFLEILQHLKRLDKKVSICTNRAKGSLEIILKKNQIYKYLDNVVSCKEEGHEKPDPYCLKELLEKYPKILKEETIYFGDSRTDAEFASNAGIDFLIIDHYLNKKQFYTMVVDSFTNFEDELLAEVDINDKEIGTIYKMEAHADPQRIHRAAHVILFNRKGKIILQRRSAKKLYDPGAWDIPGGHQAYGQTIKQTAKIELMEEMGITGELNFEKKWLKQDGKQSEYCYVFYIIHDGPYKYDKNEVSEIEKFDCRKLLNHEYDDKYQILPHVYDYIEEFKDVWEKLI